MRKLEVLVAWLQKGCGWDWPDAGDTLKSGYVCPDLQKAGSWGLPPCSRPWRGQSSFGV